MYIVFAIVIFIAFIMFVIIDKVITKKKMRLKNEEEQNRRRRHIHSKFQNLITAQDAIFKEYEKYRDKAILYEDLNTVNKLDEYICQFNNLILDFNEAIERTQYYEDVLKCIFIMNEKMGEICAELLKCSRQTRDLREYHHGTAEEQEAFRKQCQKIKENHRIPFKDSKYFRGCKTKEELSQKYKVLVKMYHPDNGGNTDDFINVREEFKKCQKELEANTLD